MTTTREPGFDGLPIVVTGGAGYIGSVVAHHLARHGARVTVVDSLVEGRREAVGALDFEQLDVRDEARLARTLERTGARAVCHLAAFANIPHSFEDPALCADVNVAGTRSVLAAMRRCGTKALVFASTCAIYAPPAATGAPLREGDAEDPASPYATSKRDAEDAIFAAEAEGQLAAVALRFFNAAGADRVARLGENHRVESHLIPLVLRWAKHGSAFKIFGTDYPTPDGTCVRDYVHVVDLAEAHACALRLLSREEGRAGQGRRVFNLGSGVGTSVLELVERVRAMLAVEATPQTAARRPGDSPFLCADPERARRSLAWQPRRDLDTILADAAWWEAQRA